MSTEEGFFKFRDEHLEKLRKQQELNLEYQKFKIMDEERFRNRFAHKKGIRPEQENENLPTNLSQSQNVINQNSENNIEMMLQKLNVIQKDVADLKRIQVNSDSINYHIDKELGTLSKPNETSSVTSPPKYPNGHESPNHRPTGNNDHFLDFDATIRSREQMKQRERVKYARELREQIEEKQRLKELERQKEKEEDQIKLKEIHEAQFNDRSSLNRKLHSELVREMYARGGNGIFGEPLSEAQKQANARYREELLNQIEEKKQRNTNRINEEREIERRERVIEESSKVDGIHLPDLAATITATSPSLQMEVEKHSVCTQVELEKKPPTNTVKALRVRRKSPQSNKPQSSPQFPDLITQIAQLKVGLATEKLRIQQNELEMDETVQVYDPRSVSLGSSLTGCSDYPILRSPIKVQRVITVPTHSIKPKTCQERGTNPLRRLSLDSDSTILPLTRSPSVDSLNLEEINNQLRRKFEEFGVGNLYENEDPIIRNFMAKEEAKIMAHPRCY